MLKFTKVTKVNKVESSWGVTLATYRLYVYIHQLQKLKL